jgi:hypothetical protein
MTTLDDRPATGTSSRLRLAAMHALADNCTAGELRSWADNAKLVDLIASRDGRPADAIRGEMLAVSVIVDAITREGLTPEHCRFVLGIDKTPAPSLALVPSAA